MVEYIMRILSIPLYLFEGYCIQFFFNRFAEPKIGRLKNMSLEAGIAWILIGIVRGALFRETDSVTLIMELLFTTVSLLSDGELRETQTANYFSNLCSIDCAVLSVNA